MKLKETWNNKEEFFIINTDILEEIKLLNIMLIFIPFSDNHELVEVELNEYNLKSINNFLNTDDGEYVEINTELKEALKKLNIKNNINNF